MVDSPMPGVNFTWLLFALRAQVKGQGGVLVAPRHSWAFKIA